MSLRLKTILGVGLIEAILLIILITVVLDYMRLSSEEHLENYVYTTSTLFATTTKDAVLSFDLASLENFIEEILKNQGVLYARIYDSEKRLLVSGGEDRYLNQAFSVDKNYKAVDDNVYDIYQVITVDDVVYGSIEIGFSTRRIEQGVVKTRQLAATIALIEMLLVALFSFCLGIYLTKQLKVLRDSARCIAAGNFNQNIEVKTHDEIGEVAYAFNTMISSLNEANKETEKYQQELIDLNQSLEKRVEQRTHEILEQKEKLESAYDKLQKTQEQLVQSEKMASIGQLAAGVAHEINNPVAFVKSNLSSLSGYINTYQELIEKQQQVLHQIAPLDNSRFQEELEKINNYYDENDIDFINQDIEGLVEESIKGTRRVTEIVQGLKVYSRASDQAMEDLDINESIQDALKMLSNELKYNCEVFTELNVLPLCQCNRGKITQVVTNLIINAVQAMEEQGRLTVKTSCQELSDSKKIIIVISDTGKGIPPDNVSKLFDPFFTTKEVGEGTGLGLSISQGIIHEHDGTIEVESILGKGTSFIITLPTQHAKA